MTKQKPVGLIEPFAQAQKGLPLLGHLVWWTIPSKLEISKPELERKLEDLGLAKNLLPAVHPRGALSTALKRLEGDELIRRVTEDMDKIVYALVKEQADESALALDYSQVQTVIYHKGPKTLEFASGAQVDKIRELFERYRVTITAPKLRTLIRRVLDQGDPVTVRSGIIFVPKKQRRVLDTAISLADSLGAGTAISRIGVVDSDETRATMLKVVRHQLDTELKQASQELDELLDKHQARSSTLARRLKSCQTLRAKVSGYADLLTFSAHDLLDRLAMLEEKIQQAV